MQVFLRLSTLTLILSAWAWEVCGIFLLLVLYRIEDKRDVLAFFSDRDGKLFLGAATLFACTSVVVAWSYISLSKGGKQPLRAFLKWNILPLILMVTIVEASFRVFSTDTPRGPVLRWRLLGPSRLDVEVPHSQRSNQLYYYDQLLGWTVRPNLNSSDGLYFTSLEGIRDSRSGGMFAASHGTCRIALIGDSHTFGLELKFEDTWGYLLEGYLPKGCKVLNFGVEGYNVGQMYLRFQRDVRPWHPNVVIMALSSHSTARTMGVYGLNIFDGHHPWAQPRFQFKDNEVKPVNVPLPPLEVIMSAKTMSDLPFIEYDWFFSPGKWELPRWRYLYKSYIFRSYVTWFPILQTHQNGDSAEAINHALLSSFVRAAKVEGAAPVVLYIPDKFDYQDMIRQETPSLSILRTSGIDHVDLRSCLDQVSAQDRFIAQGDHYSLKGSSAIARCVFDRLPSWGH